MSTTIKQPTANESPDSGQGGIAVTNASNTGHDSTTSAALDPDTQLKTCRWSGFQAVAGQITAVALKFSWSEDGSTSGGGLNNFTVERSVNGGGAWTSVFSHSPSAPGSGSENIALSVGQDLTQVQLRDSLLANASGGGGASVTGGISDIRIEVTVVDAAPVVMM